jgi:hypothetical protein
MNDINKIQEFFNKNKFVVIKKFINPDIVNIFYQYTILKVQQVDYKKLHYPEHYNKDWDGKFGDPQIPNSYNCYGDLLMESVLTSSIQQMQAYTGMSLVPTYSYWRFYQQGDVLKKHRDRNSCEISATLCLGYNTENLKDSNYVWPICVESNLDPSTDHVAIDLSPGDLIIYKGCEIDHWRDAYQGLNHSQVFLHYNKEDNPKNNLMDGRSILGIPHGF